MSYYKYKERDKSHFVDWGTIGKEMTDMLSLQRKERAAKRDIVEEGQRTQRKELAALPKGVDVNANEQTMALAEQSQTYLLDLHRLLQSGDISYGQYKTAFSNVQTNTEMYLDSATNYNESAAESKRRWDEGESSMLEPWSRAQTEEYNNYSKWTPQIDVATGNMNLLSRSGEESAMPIVMMAGMTRAQYNKFDVMGSVSTAAQSLEQYIKDARQMGTGLLTIEGLSALKTNSEFIEAENSIINSKLTNPNDVASVLLDSVKFDDDQRQYTPTTSPEEAAKDPSYILMIANPSQPGGSGTSASYGTPGEQYVRDNYPDQADEIIKNIKTQYDEAKDALRDALHLQIPNIETPGSAGTMTDGQRESQEKAEKANATALGLGYIFSAPPEVQRIYATNMVGKVVGDRVIKRVDPTSNTLRIEYEDGESQEISMEDRSLSKFLIATQGIHGASNGGITSLLSNELAEFNALDNNDDDQTRAYSTVRTPRSSGLEPAMIDMISGRIQRRDSEEVLQDISPHNALIALEDKDGQEFVSGAIDILQQMRVKADGVKMVEITQGGDRQEAIRFYVEGKTESPVFIAMEDRGIAFRKLVTLLAKNKGIIPLDKLKDALPTSSQAYNTEEFVREFNAPANDNEAPSGVSVPEFIVPTLEEE